MKLKCLSCGRQFKGNYSYDDLGWHSMCPKCGSSFDVDAPEHMQIIKNLIDSMIQYGLEFCWNDTEVIDTLVECGITKEDFACCGYGDFVKEYFEEV